VGVGGYDGLWFDDRVAVDYVDSTGCEVPGPARSIDCVPIRRLPGLLGGRVRQLCTATVAGYGSPVSDDPYRDAELVELYDLDNPGGEDHAYYRALADEIDARSIVDLGCGTGLLTRSLVRPGRTVIGVDRSRTMLDYARRQPGAEFVTWIHGDASALALTGTADLAICTGNAIMHVSPQELPSTLASLAKALRSGGTFSFESRNPAYREWERWTPEATCGERATPAGYRREWLEVTEAREGRVVFDAHNVFPDGEDRVYTSILFFHSVEEFQRELDLAGFTGITWTGDWHGAPVDDRSRIFVFRARRA
jgi:SAM-dependent methyltransferase